MTIQLRNNASSSLATEHSTGSGTLVLKSGEGARFGTPTVDRPLRVTVVKRLSLVNGQIAPTSTQTIFDVTARSGDTLSGLTAVEGTADQAFSRLDPVAVLITAEPINDLFEAVGSIDVDLTEITENVEAVAADVATKADDTAVVKLTGDQVVAGVKTSTDVIVHDLTANVSARATRIIPPTTAPPIDFLITGFAGGNVPGGSNGYQNGVISIGWNCEGGASKINPDWPTFRIGMENNYWTGSEYWMEGHLFAFTPHNSSGERRPFSVGVNKSNNYDIFTIFQGSTWTWANPGQEKQRAQLYADANSNVGFRVVGDDTLDSFNLLSSASPKTDVLTVGRTSSTQTNVTFSSSGFTNLYLVAGSSTASITTTTTILAIKAPAAGGFLQERADNYQLLNWAASRFIIRAGDNGTAAQIGFLGAAPVSRQSGEITTGLVNLGLFSSVTIAQSSVTNLVTDLAAKAPLASPTFTGPVTLVGRSGPIQANSDSATITLDLSASDFHTVTLGGHRTLALTGTAPQSFKVKLIQSGAGSWNPTWWSGITWYTSDGLKPTPSAATGKGTYVQFLTTGSGTYDGFLVAGQA